MTDRDRKGGMVTEDSNDPYVKQYYRLRKIALAKGFDLRYSRRRANIIDILFDGLDCEEGAWVTGEERLTLVEVRGDDRFTIWVSSLAEAATVFQETADWLEIRDPDDPGIARAACAREESQEMVKQIVAWVTEMAGE